MTREEAIKYLIKPVVTSTEIGDIKAKELEAYDMAIEALSAEAIPQGEWTYLYGSIGSYMTISCPFCGETFDNVAEWKYSYCPSCGAKMKGVDHETG